MKIIKMLPNYNKSFTRTKITQSKFGLKHYAKNINSKLDLINKKTPLPLKYYLIGLALPIPFASTIGLIIGSSLFVGKKVKEIFNK